jgi:hypothetical protein
LMTLDPVIGSHHWNSAFQIYDCSDGVIIGLKSMICGCYSGVTNSFMTFDKALAVCVEFDSAFAVNWNGKESNKMAKETISS